ncbi:MAG: hypothetical protein AMXMBFR84_11650 [Candidatus Hydrogenedentota bacterium]
MTHQAKDVLQQLKELGSLHNAAIYRRHGIAGEIFGVSYAHLRPMAKRLSKDSALAQALWNSAVHDARILACMIADPATFPRALADVWIRDLDNYVVTDEFAKLAGSLPYAQRLIKAWSQSDEEWTASAGWTALSVYALQNPVPPNSYFAEYVDEIRASIHTRKNRVRHAMNQALIAIGLRNDDLQAMALGAAMTIGKVNVDHGETNCVTPDAASYILKAVERRKRVADRKAEKNKNALKKNRRKNR